MLIVSWDAGAAGPQKIEVPNESAAEVAARDLVARGVHRVVYYEVDDTTIETDVDADVEGVA